MEYKTETIAAISTPIGTGGIGIIRISGESAGYIARNIFRPKKPTKSFKSFHLYLGHIIDSESGIPVDEVLLSFMRSPFSYTREDMVEINSHSGYTVLSNILQIVLQKGARPANPGEFTLRAFLNGRVDLTQAESVLDIINAKSDVSIRMASGNLSGSMGKKVRRIRDEIFDILVRLEADIDFPEEENAKINRLEAASQIEGKIIGPIRDLADEYRQRKVWQEGISVVIAGRVNAGKSSILNRILDQEKAIVTPVPGTTRDILECAVNIKGIPLKLIDTAGVRKVKGVIERQGLELTNRQIESSDMLLWVVDRTRPLNKYDLDIVGKADKQKTIWVINKADLPAKISSKRINSVFRDCPKVEISALTGQGLEDLYSTIFRRITGNGKTVTQKNIMPNLRHKVLLDKAEKFLKQACINLKNGLPLETVAIELYSARDCVNEITGEKMDQDVLKNIFSRFCIGK